MAATRRLAAIMFTDMVGFTAAAQSDESGALARLREQEELVRPILNAHQGREIKSTGDGFLVEFDSALQAAQCAIDIHRQLHERNLRSGASPILLRIGVHLGDVEEREGDIFGDAVNIASRVEPLAAPGGVCVSGPVFDQVRNKLPARFEKLAGKTLRNVQIPVDVYRLAMPWDVPELPSQLAPKVRLAVLPFANISPDPRDEYFADGLTEEVISSCSKIPGLRVIARTSVSLYKAAPKTVAQIGSDLHVATILEGSVRKSGNRIRITVQLIDVASEEHIWANSYDRALDDVFAVQTDVAERTAAALRIELLGPERESIQKRPTANLDAYTLYLRGIHAIRQSTDEGFKRSIDFFGQAIALDPNFALAYAYLSNVYILLAGDRMAARDAFPHARVLVTKALELDPSSSGAHTARGNLAMQCDQDWSTAETELQWAIFLNPSNADAHFWYGMLLRATRRFDEAANQFRRTLELEPLWWLPRAWLLLTYVAANNLEAVSTVAEELRRTDHDEPLLHLALGIIYARLGREKQALDAHDRSNGELNWYGRWLHATLGASLHRGGEAEDLLADWIDRAKVRYVNPTLIAGLYAALGRRVEALDWLDRDVRGLWAVYQEIAYDPVRNDPRFQHMLRQLHLPSGPASTSPSREDGDIARSASGS